jgi:hypothetical protein
VNPARFSGPLRIAILSPSRDKLDLIQCLDAIVSDTSEI